MEASKCFFTGHRIIPSVSSDRLYAKTEEACRYLIEQYGVTDFIAGGALGFDTMAAEIVLRLRKLYPNIKLHLYLPCLDQTGSWKKNDVDKWQSILNAADDYRYITPGSYTSGCMHKRNRAMADDALYGIAYCTRNAGGTAYTLRYARSLGRKIILIN